MCTVTLTTLSDGFVLTSNRDEAIARKTLSPQIYSEAGVKLLYPRDQEAGGTWIGLSEQKRAICLLNGGFEPHERKPVYRKSRGLVVKDLLRSSEFLPAIEQYDFAGIEPFTCVIADYHQKGDFYELVWDGKDKHFKILDNGSYIWSSSLLYSQEVRKQREERFVRFRSQRVLNPENLMDFHASKGSEKDEGLIIDRGFLKTCSITQILLQGQEVQMSYQDLLEKEEPKLWRTKIN